MIGIFQCRPILTTQYYLRIIFHTIKLYIFVHTSTDHIQLPMTNFISLFPSPLFFPKPTAGPKIFCVNMMLI